MKIRVARGFSVLESARSLQAASMVLGAGESSGEKGNEHPESEQLLLVIEGTVIAEIGDTRTRLNAGEFVIVPRGASHQFRNDDKTKNAVTFNVYAPPAY